MKRFASLKGSSSNRHSYSGPSPRVMDDEKASIAGSVNTGAETNVETPLTLDPPNLKVQKLDYYYSRWTRSWKYKKMGSNAVAEVVKAPPRKGNADDAWAQYCFVVVRTIRNDQEGNPIHSFRVALKSEYLIKALKKVTADVNTISWNSEPLEIDPKVLLAYLPQIEAYHTALSEQGKAATTLEETYTLQTLSVFLSYLKQDYRATISSFNKLISHGEITSELLPMLFTPRTIVLSPCPTTGELQALKVTNVHEMALPVGPVFMVNCSHMDVTTTNSNADDFGLVTDQRVILPFSGAKKITSLEVYPLSFHPDPEGIKAHLITRGRKWARLETENDGMAHMSYKGQAAIKVNCKTIKYTVNSRVMIDRVNFKKFVPNYPFPLAAPKEIPASGVIEPPIGYIPPPSPTPVQWDSNGNPIPAVPLQWMPPNEVVAPKKELTEEELMLAPAILYGFSLGDKMWLELNVEKVSSIQWNEEAFRSLVLPSSRKVLLQSLVEAHHEDLGFDDFVRGKGQGLVVNLFGPPGVGKTLSAEATSEHVKRPLYVIGAGDLGTNASDLDMILSRTFELATAWKAIVLIDEADVFLEKRSMHDLERNAMVAVFLRHLEYYRGILFLTTNRVQTFDDAFLSRIHIALRFYDLSVEAKIQVWRAFLAKLEVSSLEIKEDEIRKLAERKVNGREIKNAVRTANSLAHARGEKIAANHFEEVLDVMEEFAMEYKKGDE